MLDGGGVQVVPTTKRREDYYMRDKGLEQKLLNQLMPRLVSSVNTVFANLVSQTDNARDAITKNVQGQLRYRFNKALGAPLIDDVRMVAYQDEKDVPGTTCPEAT